MDGEKVDAVFLALGKWGRWQILQAIWLALTYIPLAFQYTSIVFVGYEPSHRCGLTNSSDGLFLSGNKTDGDAVFKQCDHWDTNSNSTTSCPGRYQYAEPRYISIVSEWDLVCESSYLVQMSQTILSFGFVPGNLLLPVADRFGRKRALVVCHWIMLVAATAIAFSPNIIVFIALKFTIGFLFPGVNIIMCVMLLELFPMDVRAKVAMVSKFVWAAGIMLLTIVAYIFRASSWRYLQLCLASFSLLVIVHTFITEESVRWLFVMSRKREAVAVLKRASKCNNVSFKEKLIPLLGGFDFGSITIPNSKQDLTLADKSYTKANANGFIISSADNTCTHDVKTDEAHEDSVPLDDVTVQSSSTPGEVEEAQTMLSGEEDEKPKLTDLFRHKTLRKYIIISTYIITVDILLYYGLLLMSSSLAGDRFMNVLLSGAVEIPAYILCLFVLDRFGRKSCLLGFHVLSGGMLSMALIINISKGPPLLVTALSTLGKFGSCGTLIVSFMHNSEIIPTNLRSSLASGSRAPSLSSAAPASVFSSHSFQKPEDDNCRKPSRI
ncbi:solute carrier family 22 member 3-like isoform X2 [Liolophura sinensis]|uniref:solute carrier family 22 member 3-like isoform X2 n=1 Tax=Liolophura sinensis TaxID=3198878 RepID=UPI003158911B